jgi:hypothetical protein
LDREGSSCSGIAWVPSLRVAQCRAGVEVELIGQLAQGYRGLRSELHGSF